MRPLPEPVDGEGARPPRSTDDTARIPRVHLDDDQIGQQEQGYGLLGRYERERPAELAGASGPGWYDRMRAETTTRHPDHPAQRVAPRHRQDDLPGPSRAELARLIRQVRALVIVTLVLVATLPFWVQGLYQLVY